MAATTASAEPGRTAPGLRELKKQRTRQALARAAVELFCAQGYERTTVDEIAAAVDVSQRTFFRYFDNKEDVAFVIEELINERFAAGVRARPAAGKGDLRRCRIDAVRLGGRATLHQQFREGAVAAADIDKTQAGRQRQPVEEDVAGDPAPLPHHFLVGGAVVEAHRVGGHFRFPYGDAGSL